ncbi:hypothetical protein [Streptomyces sp. NPDC090093]|uniref:hypothetical protein n=1 Tax=Streptomyces sp. NPDC090093 TaxID=3365945 RepID=UPI00381ACFF6
MSSTDEPWLHTEHGASIGHTEAWTWAEEFRIRFDRCRRGGERRPVLVVGPYPIDLIDAAEAATRLERDAYEALLTDEGRPWPRGSAYALRSGEAVPRQAGPDDPLG